MKGIFKIVETKEFDVLVSKTLSEDKTKHGISLTAIPKIGDQATISVFFNSETDRDNAFNAIHKDSPIIQSLIKILQ